MTEGACEPRLGLLAADHKDDRKNEIADRLFYERGLPCAECGELTFPENYECACPR